MGCSENKCKWHNKCVVDTDPVRVDGLPECFERPDEPKKSSPTGKRIEISYEGPGKAVVKQVVYTRSELRMELSLMSEHIKLMTIQFFPTGRREHGSRKTLLDAARRGTLFTEEDAK